jgi:pilus assembly protein CpaB
MVQKNDKWIQLAKRLALPLLLGAATVVGVHQYLTGRIEAIDAQSQQDMVTRIVTSSALPAGTVLTFEHLSLRDMPKAWASADSFEASEVDLLEGLLLAQDVMAGQPLTRSILRSPTPPALSEQLAPGRRALTIPVDHVSSLSGRLEVGDLIDLYVTFTHRGERVTTLLVGAVKVLATDRSAGGYDYAAGQSTVTSVTLDVSAAQAVKLVSANQGGALTAVLRIDEVSNNGRSTAADRQAGKANHLAGFTGLAPSFGEEAAPNIIYGDTGAILEQMP